jgi:hypothetical protein
MGLAPRLRQKGVGIGARLVLLLLAVGERVGFWNASATDLSSVIAMMLAVVMRMPLR